MSDPGAMPRALQIDLEGGTVAVDGGEPLRLDTPEAFSAISHAWLRAGWDTKYVYSFAWFGRPIIQLPEDMVRMQEVIWDVQPDVIIETGIAHGGSLIYYASICKAMEKGRVIGVDIEIRPHNRTAMEEHPLSSLVTMIEADSVAPATIEQVRSLMKPGETALVILDSHHLRDHVLAELRAYAEFVTPGSYIVATDGIMGQVVGGPRTQPDWSWNNPKEAAAAFVAENPDFSVVEPQFPFNEGVVTERVTYWPGAYVRRDR